MPFNPASTLPQVQLYLAQLLKDGLQYYRLGQLEKAEGSFERILEISPHDFNALQLLGAIAAQQQNYVKALERLDQALQQEPSHLGVLNNRALVLKDLGRLDEAYNAAQDILLKVPRFAPAHVTQGDILRDQGRLDDALDSYNRALGLDPNFAQAYFHRGIALHGLGQHQVAIASYDKALDLQNHFPSAHLNRAIALQALHQFSQALVSYKTAIDQDPNYALAFLNKGTALQANGEPEQALESYEKALQIDSKLHHASINAAKLLVQLNRPVEALIYFKKVYASTPRYPFLAGYILDAKMRTCEWEDYDALVHSIILGVERSELVCAPSSLIRAINSPQLEQKAAQIFIDHQHPENLILGCIPKDEKKPKIRLGYFSSYFNNHATAHLATGLFESHNRTQFEVIGFSFSPPTSDEVSLRIRHAFDQFYDVHDLPDMEIAQLARRLQVDIAVDMQGFHDPARTGVFALRCAPIQVNYLTYAGTMGASYYDYLIADHTIIPAYSEKWYSEEIAYLPNCYQANDAQRNISPEIHTRAQWHLPENQFVFCAFNANNKITPFLFDSWMRVLQNVPESVLWLLEDNQTASNNLRKYAQEKGVNSTRLIFASRIPLASHLARQKVADLFLDTFPYNAHTTASDALWVGLPVLTYMGESFASRVAASLLKTLGVPELITHSLLEYEDRAIALANQPNRLKEIRTLVEEGRLHSALFNTKRYTQDIENVYLGMQPKFKN